MIWHHHLFPINLTIIGLTALWQATSTRIIEGVWHGYKPDMENIYAPTNVVSWCSSHDDETKIKSPCIEGGFAHSAEYGERALKESNKNPTVDDFPPNRNVLPFCCIWSICLYWVSLMDQFKPQKIWHQDVYCHYLQYLKPFPQVIFML